MTILNLINKFFFYYTNKKVYSTNHRNNNKTNLSNFLICRINFLSKYFVKYFEYEQKKNYHFNKLN